ncbi:transcriptional regulator [Paraburkholderia fungorum]|uniref:helix-turn-helix domain-containing protein n=1 Tax=Paraburkholderia fungorum TaxID=134537 RepID=UPI0026D1AC47|nr:transcriptional regulator [Paraburkholderia fungorum]
MLKTPHRESHLSQEELTRPTGVARTTIARVETETLAKSDVSVSERLRLFEAAGYDLNVAYSVQVTGGHSKRPPHA